MEELQQQKTCEYTSYQLSLREPRDALSVKILSPDGTGSGG